MPPYSPEVTPACALRFGGFFLFLRKGLAVQSDHKHYEQLYHLLNNKRGIEYEKIRQLIDTAVMMYAKVLERDITFQSEIYSWEREMSNAILIHLNSLLESFIETDKMAENLVLPCNIIQFPQDDKENLEAAPDTVRPSDN